MNERTQFDSNYKPKITKHFSSAFFDGRRILTIWEKNVSSLSTDVDHQEFFHSWTKTVRNFSWKDFFYFFDVFEKTNEFLGSLEVF